MLGVDDGLLQPVRGLDQFACALEVSAHYTAFGDTHLLALKHFHGFRIVDVKTFVARVKGR